MTNLIKRKCLLFLIAVVVISAMMSVACKELITTKPEAKDFIIEGGDITIADPVNPTDDPTGADGTLMPDGTITIKTNVTIGQYSGKYFESEKLYQTPDGTKFRYSIKIVDHEVKFVGYDKNGTNIDQTYAGGSPNFKNQSAEKQEYVLYQFGKHETAELVIYATGYLNFKPKALDSYVRLALKNK